MRDTGHFPYRLSPLAIRSGVWEGRLAGVPEDAAPPEIDLCHRDTPVAEAEVKQSNTGAWLVSVELPVTSMSDGLQTFTLVERQSGIMLESFAVSLGEPLDADLRAEIDLLRAELDLLKRAFRRHCAGE